MSGRAGCGLMSEEPKSGLLHYFCQAWLVIVLAVAFAIALAGVESVTRPRIVQNRKDLIARRLVEMFGQGTTTDAPKVVSATIDGRSRKVECYPAIREGEQIGWGSLAEGKGYDTLLLLVGVDLPAKKIIGYRVVKILEAPGIGDRIEKPEFYERFKDKDATSPLEAVGPDTPTGGQKVQTISGATISSTGVIATVNKNLQAVREQLAKLAGETK